MKSKITSSVFLILCLLTSCSKDEMELLLETPEQTDNDHIKLPQKIYILKSLKIRLLTPENT